MITVATALTHATNRLRSSSPTARLDAEVLLAHALGWSRVQVLAALRDPLDQPAVAEFEQLVDRRLNLEPVAYLIGHREFYGLDMLVTPAVLVPRPETELLVELALQYTRLYSAPRIADIGTGSGCIAIALAVHCPTAQIIAVDLSPAALVVAQANCERHHVNEQIELLVGDLLQPVGQPVDLIVSNPPYTLLNEIDEGVRRHEPHLALDGGADGLDLYRRLLADAPAKLSPGGMLLCEIGATQGAAVLALAHAVFPQATCHIHRDLANHDRVLVIAPNESKKPIAKP
jgi:release factor glutamine methyltransferase